MAQSHFVFLHKRFRRQQIGCREATPFLFHEYDSLDDSDSFCVFDTLQLRDETMSRRRERGSGPGPFEPRMTSRECTSPFLAHT